MASCQRPSTTACGGMPRKFFVSTPVQSTATAVHVLRDACVAFSWLAWMEGPWTAASLGPAACTGGGCLCLVQQAGHIHGSSPPTTFHARPKQPRAREGDSTLPRRRAAHDNLGASQTFPSKRKDAQQVWDVVDTLLEGLVPQHQALPGPSTGHLLVHLGMKGGKHERASGRRRRAVPGTPETLRAGGSAGPGPLVSSRSPALHLHCVVHVQQVHVCHAQLVQLFLRGELEAQLPPRGARLGVVCGTGECARLTRGRGRHLGCSTDKHGLKSPAGPACRGRPPTCRACRHRSAHPTRLTPTRPGSPGPTCAAEQDDGHADGTADALDRFQQSAAVA